MLNKSSPTNDKRFINRPVIELLKKARSEQQNQPVEKVCPYCLRYYILGKTGIISGCDKCEGIARDRSGMIIGNYEFEDLFKEQTDDEEGKQS